MSFFEWITCVISSVPLACLTFLTLCVIFVNGWTDAPNAIASCVVTRVLTPKGAVVMASICNFFGLILSVVVNRTVTDTVYSMVDFGPEVSLSRIALCAALTAVVVWAVSAWFFGIPTSESHALIAGITGAAFALRGGDGIRFSVWSRVLWGLLLSVGIGFLFGWLSTRMILYFFSKIRRDRAQFIFFRTQILGGAMNAFLHGAQDGQKFIGVLLLSVAAHTGESVAEIPLWMVLLCSVVLSCGTALGGGRIIRAVGMKMLKLERFQGVASDVASAVSLLICSVFGLPVSTTHVKTTSVMGAGSAVRIRSVNWSIAGQMVAAWCLTFPSCGLLGYGMAKMFLMLFQ